ncbi:MAG TPA: hypothetical protein VK989_13490 [Polyangia bacterium]|jgi:hypothetical protein|nr:hypothetical protein [Polyangia bacterium]
MRRAAPLVILLLAAFAGCRRPSETSPGERAVVEKGPAPQPLALPDTLAGFAGGPIQHGPTWIRRTYAHGATLVDTTLAMAQQPPGGFDGWVTTSRAGYPQAALAAPPRDVNGFYQCSDGPPPSCDLLIQMRSGIHLELRGGGTSSRADVDALAAAMPLAAWGAGAIDDPH